MFSKLIFIIIFLLSVKWDAQIAPLYSNAPRCIFLRTDSVIIESGPQFYNIAQPMIIHKRQIVGFSLDKNLKQENGKKYLSFELRYFKSTQKEGFAVINLYFNNLPDTINYYFEINNLRLGKITNINVPSDENTLKKLKIVSTRTIKGTAYDITPYVISKN